MKQSKSIVSADGESYDKIKSKFVGAETPLIKEIEQACKKYEGMSQEQLEKRGFENGQKWEFLDCVKKSILLVHEDYVERKGKIEEERKIFEVSHVKDFLRDITKTKYLIYPFFSEKSINLLWGSPASFKSLFALYMASCLSTGKKFLKKYKTKKTSILYCSGENPSNLEQVRLKAVFKGMEISLRRKNDNLQFHFLPRKHCSTFLNNKFYLYLEEYVEKNKIKFLIFDTFGSFSSGIDDNKSNDILSFFSDYLFPLVDKHDLNILLIHHSQKTGRDFLGSVKIMGEVDNSYELVRDGENLSLLAHKSRDGEHNLTMKIEFENYKNQLKKVRFKHISEFDGKMTPNSKNESKIESAKSLILEHLLGKEMGFNEIMRGVLAKGLKTSTIKRAIGSLYDEKLIKKTSKSGGYVVS